MRHKSRWLILAAGIGAISLTGLVAGVIGAYYYVAPGLPAAETIRDIPLQIPLRIFSRDGHLISEIGERRRILVTYDEVPEHVVNAFVAAEDQRFWTHPGIDYRGFLRALYRLVTTGSAAGGGGSTLTQQLARSYFFNLDKTAERKFKEGALAMRIEGEFDKQQIMALFLNKMFFGQRAYGVAAAAQVYFNKNLQDLSVAEAATLAGVLPAPSKYNPVFSVESAAMRRGYVLSRMLSLGYIDDLGYEEAMAVPIYSRAFGAAIELNAPFVAEMARRDMLRRYGEETYTAGYQVVTTLDSRQQNAANYALRNGLLEYTRRRGYRGPLARIELTDELLATAFEEWPVELRQALEQYAPGGLSVALVTGLNEENDSATIVFGDGSEDTVPWGGIEWANPFLSRESFGPAPKAVTDVLATGDLILVMPTDGGWALAQEPEAQGAIVTLDPYDGAITSLAGGFDFATSKFNRATQAARQPGSSFKPFIYSAALEHGNTVASVILDAPIVISSSELEGVWRPINYTGKFYGPTRLRDALVRSMNLVSVRLLLFETGVGNAVRHLENFGFGGAALPHNGSLALGGGSASPLDMAQGFAVFANGGYGVKPYVIDAIYGPEGETLYRSEPLVVCEACQAEPEDDLSLDFEREQEHEELDEEALLEQMAEVADSYRPDAAVAPELFESVNAAPRVISAGNAFLIQDLMRDVIRRGTGRRALTLGRRDLSGKTGTSNDQRDAWFGGFNADIATVVWVGYDDDLPLGPGEEGSRTALPIWIEFMRSALDGAPEHQMPIPDEIVSVRIDPSTGCPASSLRGFTMFEYFREGHVPECEDVGDAVDIFNDAGRTDPGALPNEAAGDEEEEPLF